MKLYKRLLSLLLVCFVCFGLFSVNAYAVEETENLVNTDFVNWDYIAFTNSSNPPDLQIQGSSSQFYKTVGWDMTFGTSALDGAVIYNLTNLTVGENYSLNFSCYPSGAIFNGYVEYYIGIGYYDTNTGEIEDFNDKFLVLSGDDFGGTYISSGYTNLSNYRDFEINFTYNEKLGSPCVFIQWVIVQPPPQSTNFFMSFDKASFSLTRQPSETEKKLDGILGWLQDIKNSIISLPETIKSNFQTFFSDLENKINDFKNIVTEKFTTLSTEFSSYITNLGNNIKGFFDDFWNKISEWFEKFKPRINVDLGFQSGALNVSTGEFVFPAGNSYVLSDVIYIPDGVEMHLNYTAINDTVVRYIPVTSKGDYTGRYDQYSTDFELLLDTSRYFRIETRSYATSSIECYVDVGWFTYYMYTLRHKIDVKIEEIKQNLHDLFIPSEGYFDDLSNRFDLLIEERFGALVTITDYLVEFFSSFNADVTKEYFDVPIININLMGYNFPIGGWQVRFVPQFNGVEILTNACKFISSVLATFAFFDGLKNKYHEVFGGGE